MQLLKTPSFKDGDMSISGNYYLVKRAGFLNKTLGEMKHNLLDNAVPGEYNYLFKSPLAFGPIGALRGAINGYGDGRGVAAGAYEGFLGAPKAKEDEEEPRTYEEALLGNPRAGSLSVLNPLSSPIIGLGIPGVPLMTIGSLRGAVNGYGDGRGILKGYVEGLSGRPIRDKKLEKQQKDRLDSHEKKSS